LVPTLAPLSFHWYVGVPPLVGVAVNVTEVPEQIVEDEAAIETEGVTAELTVIVTEFDVAGLPETQVPLEVIIQVTTLLFAKVVEVKVGLLVPALVPFTCH
jgi:hypothetical protein